MRDTENIPFTYQGGIDEFIRQEVKPYATDAYVDYSQTKIGYEISFTKYFYKPVELRSMQDIVADLKSLENNTSGLLDAILNEVAK